MSYQFTYILMSLSFLFFWLVLFLLRRDNQKQMLIMSIIFGIAGPLADSVYTQDWWKPLSITHTRIGIETVLFGFGIGGIASVIYMDIFKQKLIKKNRNESEIKIDNLKFILLLLTLGSLFFGCFYIMHINSFLATIIAFLFPTVIIYINRPDLIIVSILTGLLLLGLSILVYSLLALVTPGWIDSFFYYKNVSHIILFNVSIDDIVWYFLAGLCIGTLYPYWKRGKYKHI